jgi:small subunit ribosomal protein S3
MGQKINPISFRLAVNKAWKSKWFSDKHYKKFLFEDIAIRKEIESSLPNATIANVIIERNTKEVVVGIHTSKPGLVIGRSGEGVNKLRATLNKILSPTRAKINIFEIKNPESNAKLVAENIAQQLGKRIAFRRAIKQAVSKAEGKVQGMKIKVSGRLNGAEIARTERYGFGPMPAQNLRADIDYAQTDAHTTYGVIGVKVWIYRDGTTEKSNN